VLGKVLNLETPVFPSVFAYPRVFSFAISAHESICLQPVSVSVTAEAETSDSEATLPAVD
jgi:hypothetical protein